MLKRNKGFTLVETLIALALLAIIMLFVSQTITVLSESTEDANDMTMDSTDNLYILLELQSAFLQSTAIHFEQDHIVLITDADDIDIYVDNKLLLINGKAITPLLKGTITATQTSATFDLILPNKSFIQTTFYVNEGGDCETTPFE